MAVSPELELKLNKLSELNMKVCNIYSEMTANSKKYIDDIFRFNATVSATAKRMAVSYAKKNIMANEELEIELAKAEREARTVADEISIMLAEEQSDFIDQLLGWREPEGKL